MNDKNNESNNAKLSFQDKLKMFNQQQAPTKNTKNINNDKTLEKKSQPHQFQNTLPIFNKKTIGANELSKIENRNKKNSKIENEKNNNIINKSFKKNEFLDIDNFKDSKITPKRITTGINPFSEENSKSKKPVKNEEKLIDKINKFTYIDKTNKEQDETKINNNKNNLNKNKTNNKDIKEITNKISIKNNKEKKDEKNSKTIKNDNLSDKNKSGHVADLRKEILSFEKGKEIQNSHKETENNFNDKNQQKKNIDNMDKNKENNLNKNKFNIAFDKLQKKSLSLLLPLGKPLIDIEKIKNIPPENTKKETKLTTNSTRTNNIPKKNLKYQQTNPFINDTEKLSQNSNKQLKKKGPIKSPKKTETKPKSLEKKVKNKRTYSTVIKNNKKEIIEEVILEPIQVKTDEKINSFCKAFVASSIPKQDIKIIENTEGEKSCCGHEECSQLPAIKPKIIYKFPEKDSKELEISNVLSFICFPNNIKICIYNDESKIFPSRNFRTCLTSQVGERYYMMMYHFLIRKTKKEFFDEYHGINSIKEKIESFQNSNNIEYIHIPYCFCLISKYSFFWQMNICLESIFLSLLNPKTKLEELKEIFSYLINSVPSPYVNTSVNFAIPNCSHLIELYPCFYQEIEVYLTTPIQLLNKIKQPNILLLLRLLLMEQKILLISNDYSTLTQVSLNLMSLLYPFSWVNIYIPVITINLLKYLESFLPFFCGMHKSLYEKEIVKNTLYKSQRDLYIFDIEENTFDISRNIQGSNKVIPLKFLNSHIPSFPKKIEDLIMNQLAILGSYYKNSVDIKASFNANKRKDIISNCIKMKEIFIQAFIELFFEYKKFLSLIGDVPIFNIKSFIKDKTESEQNFFKEFTSTQIFQIFIQNASNFMNKKDKKFYFDELIEEYMTKKKRDEKNQKNFFIIVNNEFEDKMNKNLYQSSKIYYVIPSKMKLFDNINEKLKDSKEINYIKQLKSNLQNEFRFYNLLGIDGKLNNNKKIIYHEFNIFETQKITKEEKNIKYYKYFITDEEKIEKEELKQEIKSKTIKIEEKEITTPYSGNINKKQSKEKSKRIKEEISESEKENIRDNIDSKLRKIFRAEKINISEDSEVLLSSMETQFGKNYFLSLLASNNEIREVKFISEDSFQILFEVLTKALLKLSLNDPKDRMFSMKLLKSFCFFKKMNEQEEVSLLENVIEYLTKKNCNLFKDEKFWELWVEEELREYNQDLFDKLRDSYENKTYYYIDEDDEKVKEFKEKGKSYIEELIKIMLGVKIIGSFILSVIKNLCDKYIQIEEFRSQKVAEIRGFGTEV